MEIRSSGIALVVLAVLASLMSLGSPSRVASPVSGAGGGLSSQSNSGGPTGFTRESASVPKTLSYDYGLRTAIDKFLNPENSLMELRSKPCPDIRFLVALVPDPVNTHLGLFYDRMIQAIQESAEKNGYDFDRAWMPWDFKSRPESDDFQKREAEARNRLSREELPGLLIFREGSGKIRSRHDASCAQPLFVFLASETPTGGMNKKQFENALTAIGWMRGEEGSSRKRTRRRLPLLILGPTFSGSLYSLKGEMDYALAQKWEDGKDDLWDYVSVFSGTVTDYAMRQWFFDTFRANSRVDFAAFQVDDKAGLIQFLEYAEHDERKLINGGRDVVIISEEGTAFGRAPGASTGVDADEVRRIYFPREISQFRSAYQNLRDAAGATGGGGGNIVPGRPLLPLDLRTTGSGDDVDLAAPLQTPRSQEAVMIGIVALLNQFKPRFVILQATDPLDEEFLARYLTTAYTRGRIVVMPPDLLLAREGDGLLQGVLAIGPYALDPEKERTGPFVFPSSLSVSTYEATSELLKVAETAWTCATDKECLAKREEMTKRREAGVLSETGTWTPLPSLKLSILGRYGYSCLASLGPERPEKPGHDENLLSRFSWDVAYGICLLIAGFQLGASCNGRVFSRMQGVALFNPLPSRKKVLLIGIGSLLLQFALVLLFDVRTHSILLWGPVIVIVGTTALEIGLRRKEFAVGGCYLIVAALLSFVVYRPGVLEAGCLDSWGPRVLDLTSGVSPLLPALMLLAGGYWWVWQGLLGEVTLGERRPKLPDIQEYVRKTEQRPRSHAAAKAAELKLSRPDEEQAKKVCVAGTTFGGWRWILLPALAIGAAVFWLLYTMRQPSPVETVEGKYFDWGYSSFFALLVLLHVICLVKIVWVWVECHPILEGLDRSGLREAFIRIKGFSWDLMWNPASNAFEQGRRILSRQVEDLGRLSSLLQTESIPEVSAAQSNPATGAEDYDVLSECRAQIYETLAQARTLGKKYAEMMARSDSKKDEREQARLLIEHFKKMQTQIATTADMIFLDLLIPVWRHDTTPALSTTEKRGGKGGEPENADIWPWRRVAEEFVALVYVSFLMKAVLQIRTLVMCATGLFLSLLIATNVYPFEPRSGLQSLIVGLFVAAGASITYVYVDMHRDATLSRLTTNEDGGGLGMAFWMKILSAGTIPLIGLLASQFPFIGNILFSWLQPALQAFK